MKKFAVVLLVLSLTRIGVAYADTNNAATSQNYFFGVKSAAANLNQVLALLVGPKGDPGPAGVAGKDGLIGMNGKDGIDGKDGLNGAPGVAGIAGKDGAGVLSVAFTGAQGGCTTGGVKFTDAAGTITYACNGRNGADGTSGSGGGGSTYVTNVNNFINPLETASAVLGDGSILVQACDPDHTVKFDVSRYFDGTDFKFDSFNFGASTSPNSLATGCADLPVTVSFKIASTVTQDNTRMYQPQDVVACFGRSPVLGSWNNAGPQVSITSGANNCKVIRRYVTVAGAPAIQTLFDLGDISTLDFTGTIGFTIG
ncbi:MAG: hypothetical protein ACKOXI_01740 [Candidatus Planktophila sp.]